MRFATGVLLGVLWCQSAAVLTAQERPLSTGETWDKRYKTEDFVYGTEPVVFLQDQIARLGNGKALCLAAGEGRNAVYLAQQGFDVLAVDISPKGLEKATRMARDRGVEIQTVVADLQEYDMGQSQYDLITDFYHYDPTLFPKVMAALKPGGKFILQNFSTEQTATNRFGPRDPAYLVMSGELLGDFAGARILYYEETVVDLNEGMHQGPGAVIRLIVEK